MERKGFSSRRRPPRGSPDSEMVEDDIDKYMKRRYLENDDDDGDHGFPGKKQKKLSLGVHSDEDDDDDDDDEIQEIPVFEVKVDDSESEDQAVDEEDKVYDAIDKEVESKYFAWGSKRNAYYGGDNKDQESTEDEEDEETRKDEETEAIKFQRKRAEQLQSMDFGFEAEFEEEQEEQTDKQQRSKRKSSDLLPIEEGTQDVEVVQRDYASLSKHELLQLVKSESPELVGLLKDLMSKIILAAECKIQLQVATGYETLRERMIHSTKQIQLSPLEFKYHLYTLYCSNIAMYASLKAAKAPGLVNHPCVERLANLRNLITKMETIDPKDWDLLGQYMGSTAVEQDHLVKKQASNLEYAGSSDDDKEDDGEEQDEKQHDKLEAQARQVPEEDHFLAEILGDDHGFKKLNQQRDKSERQGVAKNLNQYISLIERDTRERNRPKHVNPEEDIPAQRANAEKQDRGAVKPISYPVESGGMNDEDTGDFDDHESIRDEDSEMDDPYVQAVQKLKKKKKDKQAEQEAKQEAKQEAPKYSRKDTIGPEDRRPISEEIMKNRGLTPYRKKQKKNPRVKHRTKYDKAVIRARGARTTAKTGPQGLYGGEFTGINTKARRSVSLK